MECQGAPRAARTARRAPECPFDPGGPMNLKPLGDRVIVRTVEQEEVTAGGIVDGKRLAPEVSDGDEVIYSKYGGTEVKLDGEDVLIQSEHDILARVAARASAPRKRAASRKPAAKKSTAKK